MPEVDRPKSTILYIEDNPMNAALIDRILSAFGYEVVIAETGFKGINAALANPPDLVLVDIDLPDISGFEVAMRLREIEAMRQTPFVAVTAQHDEEYRRMARLSGIKSYLTKPVNVDLLVKRVEGYLKSKDNAALAASAKDGDEVYDKQMVEALKSRVHELEANNAELRANNLELVENLVEKLRTVEAANEELRRLDQLKDDFIERTAHEVRTPLTVVVGYNAMLTSSSTLKEAAHTDPALQMYVQGLAESVERMRKAVEEIVMVSRVVSGKLNVTISAADPRKIVRGAIDSFSHILGSERQITIEMTDTTEWPQMAKLDADLVRLALVDIIGNGIKYTPDGGKVTIDVQKTDTHIVFKVSDSGIGIPPEEHERIFERFYSIGDIMRHSTSKTAYLGGGLGVGLANCRAIVEAHSGRMLVESERRSEQDLPGSTFIMEIPLDPVVNKRDNT